MAWSPMSDSENSDILDEIRDLESILATTPANPKSSQTFSFEANHEPCEVDLISDNSNDTKDSSLDHVTAVFNLNKQLIEELINAKNEVSTMLEDCNKKLQIIETKIKQHAKNWMDNPKFAISTAGMPYFKDKDYFGAPRNDDVKLKIARGELQIVNFQKGRTWSVKDRTTLLNAIYHEVTSFVIDNSDKKEKEKTASYQNMFNKILSGKNLEEVVCMLGKKKFDWLKIAAMNFDNKHSADECSIMWNILLHPSINRKKWTQAEELKLQKIAKIYRYQDWDNIAKTLDTKRSGYQCLIKYNCTDNLSKLIDRSWTIEEDEKLCNIVAECRIGDFVPWNEVINYMNLRSKSQIYFRWMFKLAPHLKKGRFTKTESDTLLQNIDKFGTDFNLISTLLMPDRTAMQLNDHYQTLMSRESTRHWTLSSDMKLIDLYKRIGPDWSKIANEFKYKNRTQVRHRYSALYKYTLKGLSMFEIPRQKNENSINLNDTDSSDEEYNNEGIDNDAEDKIDQLLIEHFQNLSTSTFYHEENLYNDPEELSKDTKELHFILESLQANLHIPDNFTYLPLMGRDKQLLFSLKAYVKSLFERQNSNEIKTIKLKMFGPEDNEGEKHHFIPPLPFEIYPHLKNDKQTDNIDYVFNSNKKFLVDVETELNTPETIISLIGGVDENIQFNKISNLRCIRRDKCVKQKICNRINTCQTSGLCKKINLPLNSSTIEKPNDQSINNSFKSKHLEHEINKNNHLNQKSHLTVYEPLGEIRGPYLDHKKDVINFPRPIMKPDYITLLCCRNFITLKNIYNIEKLLSVLEEHQGIEKEHKFETAYELLEKRLIHLFKYTISMSHLSLKEINGTLEIFSMESKNMVCKKRKLPQKGMFQRKKGRTKPLEMFIYDSNASMQLLDKPKKS